MHDDERSPLPLSQWRPARRHHRGGAPARYSFPRMPRRDERRRVRGRTAARCAHRAGGRDHARHATRDRDLPRRRSLRDAARRGRAVLAFQRVAGSDARERGARRRVRRWPAHASCRKRQRRRLFARALRPHARAIRARTWDGPGPHVWHAHCVKLDAHGIDLFARTGTGVAHCPTSNMRLGSGITPVRRMLDAGVHVGLGVDGSASNDSSHLLAETRQTLLLQRVGAGPAALTAREALRLATRGGARVLGRDDIGSARARHGIGHRGLRPHRHRVRRGG